MLINKPIDVCKKKVLSSIYVLYGSQLNVAYCLYLTRSEICKNVHFFSFLFNESSLSSVFLEGSFFLGNINSPTCSCFSKLCFVETLSPAVLNTRSDATLVPGIQRYLLARDDISGKSCCWIHHCRGFFFFFLQEQRLRLLYLLTSSLTLSLVDEHPHLNILSQEL